MPRGWSYCDDDGIVQGPFEAAWLRAWHEQGLLFGDLEVCFGGDGKREHFARLGDLYPGAGAMTAPDPNQPPCFDFDLEKDIEATQRCAEAATALFHGAEDA